MKWLTISQIKRRSYTAKGALKVSYEHWNQLYDATATELRAESKRIGTELIRGDYCGLCEYKHISRPPDDVCRYCIFDDFCEDSLWQRASTEYWAWYKRKKSGNWHAWKRACKAVRDKLKELMDGDLAEA